MPNITARSLVDALWVTVEMVRAQLEALLQADWNRDALAVYADFLLGIGDPRGELVAAGLQNPNSERSARVAGLLGADVAARFKSSATVMGFFDDLRINEVTGDPGESLRALAATPMWPYVRGVTLAGPRRFVAAALAALADHRHPWLRRLTVMVYGGVRVGRGPLATPAVTADLVDNTPILHTVQIYGQRVFGAFVHPSVVKWELFGADAVAFHSK